MTTSPDQQPAQAYAQPPTIIINNTSSAAASATAMVGGMGLRRRRQSLWVHFWLFMFTAGIGNIFYAVHVSRWNRDRGL
ncbi:hypothetical protein [Streptomyces sp. NBC_00162]|uniref:hypothetical protein n=1 Tax=Streptomyces sp. NBC_00162 TaxID=2903629 RepID=UPI00214AC23D|nr:hypothetical protein [Streptomyces sp. NBC_00162]UUU40813.1 hypothetical protein JIW86_19445 [Streptomyces sp. NBC_00162]